jgi:BirA family biotin operon repressor/biotin-[acetyl-CoA-carboxylase] ligase
MIRHLAEVGSTNDVARAWAGEGAPHGATVSADHQTAGRGRLGRSWTAAPGDSLAMSVVVRVAWPPERVGWVALAAAVAVARACGPGFRIKWPNDVWAPDGRKVAGVLCEAEWARGELAYVVVGIGVNVRSAPPQLPATSLLAAGVHTTPALLRDRVRDELLAALTLAPDALRAAWVERSATLGRRVRVGEVEGVAEDLLPDGGLRVRLDDGGAADVRSGDVALVS